MAFMAAACRLCEADSKDLKHIFNKEQVNHDNLAEVILVMTGVKVEPTDKVSQKVCTRCCNIVQKMYKYRLDAQKQDKTLKEKYAQYGKEQKKKESISSAENVSLNKELSKSLKGKSEKLKSVKKEPTNNFKTKIPLKLHPSINEIFRNNPTLKLPKRSFEMDLKPTVWLKMGEVESYFIKKALDISKKKTSQVTESVDRTSKNKTVTPIKISKRALEKHDSNLWANDNLTSTRKRKKSTSSVASSSTVISYSSTSEYYTEMNRFQEVREKTPVQEISNKELSTPGTPGSLLMLSNETKSQPIFLCDLCGSVQYSNYMLKNHLAKKHMVCQFCKKRFKSLEAKDEHINNKCEVKQIMNSNGPAVKLQKVDKILEVRKKYQSAFVGWDPIPGLEDKMSVQKLSASDGIIEILSDDEDCVSRQNEVVPAFEAKLKPDVRIKNNLVLNNITLNASDVQVNKELLSIVVPKPKLKNLETQTAFPTNHDIIVNADGNAELKYLKEHLKVFKIPLTIKNGTELNATYACREDKSSSIFDYWSHLPVKDIPTHQLNALFSNKNHFLSQPISTSSSITLKQMDDSLPLKENTQLQYGSAKNISTGYIIPQNISASVPPAASIKIISSAAKSRPNPYIASSNSNLTPQLSFPKPSVNYNPSRLVSPENIVPIVLNHQLNGNFSNSTTPNDLSKLPNIVATSAGTIIYPSVTNTNNVVMTNQTPKIRVRSVKELQ